MGAGLLVFTNQVQRLFCAQKGRCRLEVRNERRKHIAEGKISARGRTEAPAQRSGCKAAGGRSDPRQMEWTAALLSRQRRYRPLQTGRYHRTGSRPAASDGDILRFLRRLGLCALLLAVPCVLVFLLYGLRVVQMSAQQLFQLRAGDQAEQARRKKQQRRHEDRQHQQPPLRNRARRRLRRRSRPGCWSAETDH